MVSARHLGERMNRHRLSKLYYWKTHRNYVSEYVKRCPIYRKTNSQNTKPFGLLQPIALLDVKWPVIIMEFIDPIYNTRNSNRHILNVNDKLSKMIRVSTITVNYDAIVVTKSC